jgi:phage I-like protein
MKTNLLRLLALRNMRAAALVCLDALTGTPAVGDIPTELRVFPFGEVPTSKGVLTFSAESAKLVMEEYERAGIDLAFDYEHASLFNNADGAPAAGWFKIEVRGDGSNSATDGLWATNIRWTDKAAAMLAAKEYAFFSPTPYVDENDHVVGLLNIALTNQPATYQMVPLVPLRTRDSRVVALSTLSFNAIERAIREALHIRLGYASDSYEVWVVEVYDARVVYELGNKFFEISYRIEGTRAVFASDPIEVVRSYVPVSTPADPAAPAAEATAMKMLLLALSLKDTATEAEALAALNKLQERERELVALTGKATASEAFGVVQAWKQGAEQVVVLSAKLQELEGARTEAEVNSILEKLASEGRMVPAQKELLSKMGRTDLAQLKAYAATAPKIVGLGSETKEPAADGAGSSGGTKWETLKPGAKAKLHHEDRAQYDALKAEYEQRTGRTV